MCGMCGYSGSKDFDVEKMKMLMLANMTRGVHSTGMFNNGTISKLADNAIEFLAEEEIIPGIIFMGHDRHATIGNKSNVDNAHPFRYGTIVGQHNGTLRNHWKMLRDQGFYMKDYDVDSQVLVSLINEDKEELKVFQELEGAAAVIWHDTDHNNRLYVYRNSERPLFRGMIGDGMYVSSIELSLKMIGCEKIQSFKENYIYCIEDGKILLENSRKVPKKQVKKNTQTNQRNHAGNHFSGGSGDDYAGYPSKPINNEINAKLDTKCYWVKCIVHKTGLEKNKWYKVIRESERALAIRTGDRTSVMFPKEYFTKFTDLNVHGHVIVLEGDDEYFGTNELLFLRGLEKVKDDDTTFAILEKLEADESTYTWGSTNIRNATQEEVDEFMFSKETNIKLSSDYNISDEEKNSFAFENSKEHMDLKKNRLGGLWLELGSSYESFIKLREGSTHLSEELAKLIDSEEMSFVLKSTLEELHIELTEMVDLSDNEIEELFTRAYDMYKGN